MRNFAEHDAVALGAVRTMVQLSAASGIAAPSVSEAAKVALEISRIGAGDQSFDSLCPRTFDGDLSVVHYSIHHFNEGMAVDF